MNRYLRWTCLICILALFISSCGQLPNVRDVLEKAGDLLPLARIGGIPIEVVAYVDFDYRETIEGYELVSSSGAWTHTVEGRLLNITGWESHLDSIDVASGSGRLHCYHPEGEEYNWTVQWSGELGFDYRIYGADPPIVHIAVYGNEALILYAPPSGFLYWHPGSPDDCQNPEPVKAHQAVSHLWFPLDDQEVERAPDAETSTVYVIQSGIVVLRIPVAKLRSGTSESNIINLKGIEEGYYGTYDWSLNITLTLTSK